jgi:hypothetical protein
LSSPATNAAFVLRNGSAIFMASTNGRALA